MQKLHRLALFDICYLLFAICYLLVAEGDLAFAHINHDWLGAIDLAREQRL